MGNLLRLPRPINPVSTDDLLHFMATMVRKAEREPATAAKSIEHAQRALDRLSERLAPQ